MGSNVSLDVYRSNLFCSLLQYVFHSVGEKERSLLGPDASICGPEWQQQLSKSRRAHTALLPTTTIYTGYGYVSRMKVLAVAEKPSVARSIAQILSGGQFTTVRARDCCVSGATID